MRLAATIPSWPRLVAMAAVVLGAGGAIGWLLWPPPPPPARAPAPPRIEVAGEPLPLGRDPVAEALDLVRRYAGTAIALALPDGTKRELRPALLGAEIDRVWLAETIKAALDPKSALARAHQRLRADDAATALRVPLPLRLDAERAVALLVSIKDELDRSPVDAMVDLEKRQLRPERWGYRLDVYGTLARIDVALRDGARTVTAAVDRIKPRVVAAELGQVKFDQVLGYFDTSYSRSARYRARTYNLRLAASRLDGTILMPGEVFDFNAVVGPRDEAHGYKVAPVIAEGELVDGIGGGTCQISGTLHGAAFFAGLEIVERVAHSRPSSYIKLGLDAAVAYPTINLRLRNDLGFPVVLHETVKAGVVRAEVLGPSRTRTVTFFRRIDEVQAFDEVERETDELPRGERVLSQRGVPGFKTTVVRLVREGAYGWRTKSSSSYPPTTQVVKVGTSTDSAKTAVKADKSPEYRADELLVVTQGPDVRTPGATEPEPGGGMVESRTPGRFGSFGWQEKLGMKVFEGGSEDRTSEADDRR